MAGTRRSRSRRGVGLGVGAFATAVVGVVVAAAWRRARLFPVRVEGDSMLPTLRPGDVLAVAGGREAQPGDVVVARARGMEMVKRVLAATPDSVTLGSDNREAGTFFVAGRAHVTGVVLARIRPRPRLLSRGRRSRS